MIEYGEYLNKIYYFCQVVYNEKMKARSEIKALIAMRCTTITGLARLMKEKTGKPYTFKSLTGKLQRGSLSLDEAYIIADLLDYKLEFVDKNG